MRMKYLLIMLGAFCLTGCSSSSVGVIDGADGPTSIIVASDHVGLISGWGIAVIALIVIIAVAAVLAFRNR